LSIDSTSARLNERSADWARFSAKLCGAKVHVVYDADADRPIYAAVSVAKVNDITMAKQMPFVPGATYVFDLGYYDYAWWAELDAVGCRIVTRFKSNTPLNQTEELPVPAGSNILSDRIGFLPARQAGSRENPMHAAACPGHPRLPCYFEKQDVDARHKAGHDGAKYSKVLIRGSLSRFI
jgi:hypothetical protein